MSDDRVNGYDIAVIGMAGRFPGAGNVDEFWQNLKTAKECIRFFDRDELVAAGENPTLLDHPDYVKAQPVLDGFDLFDAGLFGFSPQDAAIMDPQHRVFLEVGWEALENAGHTAERFAGNIGVFATCGMNTYMTRHVMTNRRIVSEVGEWLVRHTGNDMNFLATRLSYQLNLSGPSMNVQTACSSALVAIHLSCQSLLTGECDMALAGGSIIVLPHNRGYLHKRGEILSPDGHCRAFDAKARGTLFGSGAGVVVLRRLADAIADGDRVLAVIKGSAVNNDGSGKVGYLAPSIGGQARAITEALAVSGVDPQTISYVETHGTGTIVGDPIEVAALTQAWRSFTPARQICGLGSVKTNIGHLGEAAGVASFIKVVQALNNDLLPPSLNYESPNPEIAFDETPFFVNSKLTPWPRRSAPRRAGITSLGAGGTNCHVIVEEPPVLPAGPSAAGPQVLVLSARTQAALAQSAKNLARHLRAHPETNLADVAFTLKTGRKLLRQRFITVCDTVDEAVAALENHADRALPLPDPDNRPIAFLFPGQGSQFPGMARGLYERETAFRHQVDRGAAIFKAAAGSDILPLIYPSVTDETARTRLSQTQVAQPALFIIEHALAQLWISRGVRPSAMIGHSLGEYVAACLAGVFSFEEGLQLVIERGRLMQQAEPGAMLVATMAAPAIEQALARSPVGAQLSIAATNGPALTVVAGPYGAIAAFEAELAAAGASGQRLQTSHAFHSQMMDPVLAAFRDRVRRVALKPPVLRYFSNLTGAWIRAEEATDPEYWVRHIRHTVRFSEAAAALRAELNPVLLEVGPGSTLGRLAQQQPAKPFAVLSSLGRPEKDPADPHTLVQSYGHLWALGCALDPSPVYNGRRRVALPTYPFEHKRYWIEPQAEAPALPAETAPADAHAPALRKKQSIEDWFSLPSWKRSSLNPAANGVAADAGWLIFGDKAGLAAAVMEEIGRLRARSPVAIRLDVRTPGDLDSLALLPLQRRAPGSGEVEIRISAAALNFADVLKATGTFAEAPFGMECAGTVARIGPDVHGLRPGDEVVAIGPGSFASYVVRDARLVVPRPAGLTLLDSATLPAAYMTAQYALRHIGQLHKGESVLIHAAAGGVGLAAVHVARAVGAEIYATAGSPAKRDYLRSLGIRHVMDSRTLDFADQITAATSGRGVDCVLNALTGEFIPKSVAVLAESGRFLEIGKREILTEDTFAALRPRRNTRYHAIDLTRLLKDDPARYGSLLKEVVEEVGDGRLTPLARTVFPIQDAAKAFHFMVQTRHIGKIVLTFESPPLAPVYVEPGRGFRRLGERRFAIDPAKPEDYVRLLDAVDISAQKIRHIAHFWSTDVTGRKSFDLQLERGFFSVMWLAKALGAAAGSNALDVTIVSAGAHQVAMDAAANPAAAAVLGPALVLPRELPNVTCRVVDITAGESRGWQRARLINRLAAELAGARGEGLVALRGTERWIRGYEPVRLPEPSIPVLRRGCVCLITGGLGGLGLALAQHLSRSAAAKLVLVSRSALPPRAQWNRWLENHGQDPASRIIRTLRACEEYGAEILVLAADVTDRKAMRRVVAEATKRFGAIDGVIHAAGTVNDGLIQMKTPSAAQQVLAPKLTGAMILDEILGDTPLDFFVLFSSVSAILGLQGQADYTAANAALDAFAEWRHGRRPGQTVSINWGAWQEVGMAANRADPVASAESTPPKHPWLDRRAQRGEEIVFSTECSRARHWVLDEHVVAGGDAVLPGTGYLELVRAAFAELSPGTPEISRVVFQTPFAVGKDESRILVIALRPNEAGWDFRILSEEGRTAHVTGRVAAATPLQRTIGVAALRRGCTAEQRIDGALDQPYMKFGPRWANLRTIAYGAGEALITLALPAAFTDDLDAIKLHPALLDMATGAAQRLLSPTGEPRFYVPISYGRLTLHRPLPAKLLSHLRRRPGAAAGIAIFDITIVDESGEVIADIEAFTMKELADGRMLVSQPAMSRPQSPFERLADGALRSGISPTEGFEAFERILAAGVAPRVVASSIDLQEWMDAVDAAVPPVATAGAVQTCAQDLSIEERLVRMYAETLGAENVQPDDDFFQLGGHSLLAVRLLVRVQNEFGKHVPLHILFEQSSARALARYIAPEEVAGPATPAAAQTGDVFVKLNDGPEVCPFYCVHSVGGEVMTYRHLAGLLGSTVRFYGIQAPQRHWNPQFYGTVEAMARTYVEALTAFQPEGPFVLGGWSAGATIALEMAQQFAARGRSVPLLVAFDGAPFNTGAGLSPWNPLYAAKVLLNLPRWIADDLLFENSYRTLIPRINTKLAALSKKALAALRRQPDLYRNDIEGFLDTTHYSGAQVELMRGVFTALRKYAPRPYAGRVLALAARTEPLYHLSQVHAIWAHLVTRLESARVPGTHESLFKHPNVQAVARVLTPALNQVSACADDHRIMVGSNQAEEVHAPLTVPEPQPV